MSPVASNLLPGGEDEHLSRSPPRNASVRFENSDRKGVCDSRRSFVEESEAGEEATKQFRGRNLGQLLKIFEATRTLADCRFPFSKGTRVEGRFEGAISQGKFEYSK